MGYLVSVAVSTNVLYNKDERLEYIVSNGRSAYTREHDTQRSISNSANSAASVTCQYNAPFVELCFCAQYVISNGYGWHDGTLCKPRSDIVNGDEGPQNQPDDCDEI